VEREPVNTADIEFPVLGEPIALELANTRYRDDGDITDYLATPTMVAAWFDASPTARTLDRPARWSRDQVGELVTLRDAIDRLARSLLGGRPGSRTDLAALNNATRRVSRYRELLWEERPTAVERVNAPNRFDRAMGAFAENAIVLLAEPAHAGGILECANADCHMLFFKQHHRRQWCQNNCGHRHRQADYYKRSRASQGPPLTKLTSDTPPFGLRARAAAQDAR
jgi:predicted RNA-binding Zn ribbon-like protein